MGDSGWIDNRFDMGEFESVKIHQRFGLEFALQGQNGVYDRWAVMRDSETGMGYIQAYLRALIWQSRLPC